MTGNASYLDNYPHPYGVFREHVTFNGMREFLEGQRVWKTNECITKGNISWDLRLRNNFGQESLGLYVACQVEDPNIDRWSIHAKVLFKIVNQIDERESAGYEMNYFGDFHVPFDDETWFRGFPSSKSKRELLDENRGFVKDDQLIVIWDIRVKKIGGFDSPKVFNFYEQFQPKSEVEFTFGRIEAVNTIQIHKALLNVHPISFFEGFTVNKNDWNIFTFELFLQALYGNRINIDTIHLILPFAQKLKVSPVIRKIEDVILREYLPIIPMEFIKLAIEYDMRRIIHAHLRNITHSTRRTLKTLNINQMSGEVMKAVMNRIFGLYQELIFMKQALTKAQRKMKQKIMNL